MFSAFVFKMQANMDPRHRDCVAFMRVNSGSYRRDLPVKHQSTGKKFALPPPHSLVVNERNTLAEAYPGDVIGIVNRGQFAIGDTIVETGSGAGVEADFVFAPLPRFQPELFARVRPRELGGHKAFTKGIDQLVAEGTVQRLQEWNQSSARPIIAAVGQLQFDVLRYRMQDEFNVAVEFDALPYQVGVWVEGDLSTFKAGYSSLLVADGDGRPMVLLENPWYKDYVARENPDHQLLDFA